MKSLSDFIYESCDPEISTHKNRTSFDFRGCGIKDWKFMEKPEVFAEITGNDIHIWIEKEQLGKELKKEVVQAKKEKNFEPWLIEVVKNAKIKDIYKLIPALWRLTIQFDNYMIVCYRHEGQVKVENRMGKKLFEYEFGTF